MAGLTLQGRHIDVPWIAASATRVRAALPCPGLACARPTKGDGRPSVSSHCGDAEEPCLCEGVIEGDEDDRGGSVVLEWSWGGEIPDIGC